MNKPPGLLTGKYLNGARPKGSRWTFVQRNGKLTKIEKLNLYDNKITVIDDLSQMNQLNNLSLGQNQITDIAVLATKRRLLNQLNLSDNQIDDISPIKGINNRLSLNLANNAIVDVRALLTLPNLAVMNLSGNNGVACDDNDPLPDEYELLYGLNPLDPDDAGMDADNDGISNIQEYILGSSPTDASDAMMDTDGDGFGNLEEIRMGTDPLNKNMMPSTVNSWIYLLLKRKAKNKAQPKLESDSKSDVQQVPKAH
jgi:hypothetical protein